VKTTHIGRTECQDFDSCRSGRLLTSELLAYVGVNVALPNIGLSKMQRRAQDRTSWWKIMETSTLQWGACPWWWWRR